MPAAKGLNRKTILRLAKEGWNQTDIAKEVGCHRTNVYYHLKKGNVYVHNPRYRPHSSLNRRAPHISVQ